MATMTAEDVRVWQDSVVIDRDGNKVGKIEDIYYDEATGRPEWALVNTGMFGMKHNFVPVTGNVQPVDGRVMVQWTERQIKDAPAIDSNEELSVQEERRLYEHYGLSTDSSQSASLYATPESATPASAAPGMQTGESAGYVEQQGVESERTYGEQGYSGEDYGTAGGGMSSSGLQEAPPISDERSQTRQGDVGTSQTQPGGVGESRSYGDQDQYGDQGQPTGTSGTESFSSSDIHRPGELVRMRKTVIETETMPSSEGQSAQSEGTTEEGGRSGREW